MRWTQATTAMSGSGAELDRLIRQRFRIYGIPAGILVEPERKVVSMSGKNGAPPLRGEGLLDTLERLMPAAAH